MQVRTTRTTVRQLGYGVWLEVVRRRDLYVVLILFVAYLLVAGGIALVGIKKASTATFLFDMGLSLSAWAAHLLTLALAIRQFPDEMENRTLYPVLARPIRRWEVVLGKWYACTLAGMIVFTGFALLNGVIVPVRESVSAIMGFQAWLFQMVSIAMMAAWAVAASVSVPKGIGMFVLGVLYFGADKLYNLLLEIDGVVGSVLGWFVQYLPAFPALNLISRFTDGRAGLDGVSVVTLVAYAGFTAGFGLLLAVWQFQRKTL